MTRYTFDPRLEFTLDERRRKCRTFSVGIVDQELRPFGSAVVARIKGPSEHPHAIRAAAGTYCDHLNALQGIPPDSRATVVLLSSQGRHAEARVVVNGRVVARCDAFDDGLNEAWAGVIAEALNARGVKP